MRSPAVSRMLSAVFFASGATSAGLPGPACSGTRMNGKVTASSAPHTKEMPNQKSARVSCRRHPTRSEAPTRLTLRADASADAVARLTVAVGPQQHHGPRATAVGAEHEHLAAHGPDLSGRQVDHGDHEPAYEILRSVQILQACGRFACAETAEVDRHPVRRVARLGEVFAAQDPADAHVDVEERLWRNRGCVRIRAVGHARSLVLPVRPPRGVRVRLLYSPAFTGFVWGTRLRHRARFS